MYKAIYTKTKVPKSTFENYLFQMNCVSTNLKVQCCMDESSVIFILYSS